MNVHVDTAEGRATICGDVIYDFNDQIVDPYHEIHADEPRVTGNHGTTKRQEKAAIKKLLNNSRFLLPVHDKPAKIEAGTWLAGSIWPCRGRWCKACRSATGSRPERRFHPLNRGRWRPLVVPSRQGTGHDHPYRA